MRSLCDQLPPDVAQKIHPDWRKNEKNYWANRDQLISQYRNQWIAFADGTVVSSGISPLDVFRVAQQSGRHPYVICVGREQEPTRMRRTAFAYDSTYPIVS